MLNLRRWMLMLQNSVLKYRPSHRAAGSWIQVCAQHVLLGKDVWVEHVHRLFVFDKKLIFLPSELKELNGSLTTAEMKAQIQELQAECSGYRERLDKIKLATNHVTPEEKQKVRNHCVL